MKRSIAECENDPSSPSTATHVHIDEHDPDTDLDLSQDRRQNHHLWLSGTNGQLQQPLPSARQAAATSRTHPKRTHHRSLSSISHKCYSSSSCTGSSIGSNETDSSSCGSGSAGGTWRGKKPHLPSSPASSPLPPLSSSSSSSSSSCQPCKSPASPSLPSSSSSSSSLNIVCTVIGVIALFFLTCILVIQFSTDVRSAIQLSHLFPATSQESGHAIGKDETSLTAEASSSSSSSSEDEDTFNQQVTSRIISLILPSDAVIRTIRSGSSLLGFKVRETGREVSVFLSIPYARPPIGRLRFAKPLPMQPWTGLRDATRFGPQCIQFKPNGTQTPWINREDNMSEDCLTLNVWTPVTIRSSASSAKGLLPVMVWFHGGAFFSGSTDLPLYDGRTLAAMGDVVVVTVNYRLGVFGFLDGRSSDAPGNQGLHDQVLALKWIQQNIQFFGGDANEVTLFGQSAGAISIGLHYLSPLSRGLFRRGILQSGAPTVSRLFYERDPSVIDVKNKLPQLALLTTCINSTDQYLKEIPLQSVISCLKSTHVDLLTSAQSTLVQELSLSFGPSAGDDFLPDLPINMLASLSEERSNRHTIQKREANETADYSDDYSDDGDSGDSSDSEDIGSEAEAEALRRGSWNGSLDHVYDHTEVMMGVNADEGSYFLHYLDPLIFGYEPHNITHNDSLAFIGKQFKFLPPHLRKILTDLFLSSDQGIADPDLVRQSLSHFISDSTFTCPATLFAERMSQVGIRTFFYLFDHKADRRKLMPDWMGVMHFDEVPFVFGHPIREPDLYSESEVRLSRDMMNAWVTFAKTGSPGIRDTSNIVRRSRNSVTASMAAGEDKDDAASSSARLPDLTWDEYTKDQPFVMLMSSGNQSRVLRDGIRESTCSRWRIILENS